MPVSTLIVGCRVTRGWTARTGSKDTWEFFGDMEFIKITSSNRLRGTWIIGRNPKNEFVEMEYPRRSFDRSPMYCSLAKPTVNRLKIRLFDAMINYTVKPVLYAVTFKSRVLNAMELAVNPILALFGWFCVLCITEDLF